MKMRCLNCLLLAVPGVFVSISGGCSGVSDTELTQVAAKEDPATSPPETAPRPVAIADDANPSPSEMDAGESKEAFKYPYPDREELFLPPATKPPSRDIRTSSNEDVALMGFAHVGEASVVLRIDGVVTSLRAGESHGDIRVRAIDPPEVQLQRGDHQWTESLVDSP